jgi:hypothetical protein
MNFLDKLQSIVKVDVSSLKEIVIGIGSHININSNNKKYDVTNKILVINPSQLNKGETQIVQELLKGHVNSGNLLLEQDSSRLLEEVREIEKKGSNRNILDFFRGKVPQTDLEILRASFVIKELHEKHEDVRGLKWDIVQRYGKRGNNISNLCTAGYFETVIKPLYDAMVASSDFTQEKFLDRYEVIVMQYPFAVFVSNRKSKSETKQEILQKIKLNKGYGIKQMNVHGIGKENVIKIQEILYEIKGEINWPAQIDSTGSFINARLTF